MKFNFIFWNQANKKKKTIHAKHESESQTPYLYINLSKKSLRVGSLVLHLCSTYYILNMDKNPLKNHKQLHMKHISTEFLAVCVLVLYKTYYARGQVQILYMLLLLCCSV